LLFSVEATILNLQIVSIHQKEGKIDGSVQIGAQTISWTYEKSIIANTNHTLRLLHFEFLDNQFYAAANDANKTIVIHNLLNNPSGYEEINPRDLAVHDHFAHIIRQYNDQNGMKHSVEGKLRFQITRAPIPTIYTFVVYEESQKEALQTLNAIAESIAVLQLNALNSIQ